MISISMNGAIGFSILSACILFLIYPAFSQEVVHSIHENYSLDNCTLQVVDIDSQAAKVWMLILAGQEPSLSIVLGINETLICGRLTMMVKRFYAGESADIVCLKINRTSISG
ncbi:MAG: hypothetical protein M0Q13_15085 [Methanothrix sp.]|jgi:hypothetical protein|nr:hypothetical protein [Methanothrix sp.]